MNPAEGVDASGNSLLHRACEVGNLSIVHYLHEAFPAMDCSRENSSGLQPLHVACSNGMLHVVMYMINNRMCDVSACSADGRSALHMAASSGCSAVLSYLLTVMPHHIYMKTESRGRQGVHSRYPADMCCCSWV